MCYMETMADDKIDLYVAAELDLGQKLGQLRAAPVSLGAGNQGILAAYCADFDVDPYEEMFYYPTDTYKLAVFDCNLTLLWKKDLGRGVVPGMWFCPFYAFDLDGDGTDEIWFVNNTDPDHPLSLNGYVLERVDSRTGASLGQWPWPAKERLQPLSYMYRNFIIGGYVHGEPVLVTAQGTYGDMYLQAWWPDLSLRWEKAIGKDEPGARGSHKLPVVDLFGDGVDRLMWGERCIDLGTGEEVFCADRELYNGHSDVILPVLDRESGRWFIYTCRESDGKASPRVVLFDDRGERVWGDVTEGHMDMGWVARLGNEGEHVAMSIRIGSKTCGPNGRFHQNMDEFIYEALTGRRVILPYSVYHTLPVDLNGDGFHELVRDIPGAEGEVLDRFGRKIGAIPGSVSFVGKLFGLPGEQVLAFQEDGKVRLWADRRARDNSEALARYANPYYSASLRAAAVGSNLALSAGL